MRHHIFKENSGHVYRIAILIKNTCFYKHELVNAYVNPLISMGVPEEDMLAFTLDYNESDKAPAGHIKDYLSKLLPALDGLGITHLYVADSAFFKVIAGVPKSEPHQGYALPCKIKGFEHMTAVLGLNYRQLIYSPDLQPKVDNSLKALASSIGGTYQSPGQGIIHSAWYPQARDVPAALQSLHKYDELTCDIEAFSLDFDKAGVGTITFCWDKHNGLAFACDYEPLAIPVDGVYGRFVPNPVVRKLLKEFFECYAGEVIYHNVGYDVKVLIATLWMKDFADVGGLLTGLEVLAKRYHDTKIMAYLATNSTSGNVLGLKSNAQEFAGNWAVDDIKDITRIPLPTLLQYNLVDGLSTHYVKEKYWPVVIADQQAQIYHELYMPSATMLIQTELTGLPLSKSRVQEVKAKLISIQQAKLATVMTSPLILEINKLLRQAAWQKDFDDRRNKAKNPDKIMPKKPEAFDDVEFNANSGPQKQRLLYEVMQLPVLDKTDSGAPATGAETIEKLINHTHDTSHKDVLEALIVYGGVDKILSTFIPAFEAAIPHSPYDGDIVWLHGSFNLGGTVSGRLSSSDPNLTNIPAKAKVKIGDVEIDLGKLVKYCFVSPPNKLFCGSDFNSLEDYISALTTKDPNKLKVYIDGFDGHCLRASYYYRDQLMHVDQDDPKSVNALKKTHEDLRQESKIPTFALTYQGTWRTLVTNLGWDPAKAQRIEGSYHEMYAVSDKYVQDRLYQASKDGYVTVAFGLRVRTPLLSQVIFGSTKMPYEAAAEGRTAGNALGQSYCMLTMRAAMDFMRKVWASPYRLRILPVALIHDAIYLLIDDDVEVVEWANRELIASMRWQELPEIQHDKVRLGAALDIFWPDWAHATTLPNNADIATLVEVCTEAVKELSKPKS